MLGISEVKQTDQAAPAAAKAAGLKELAALAVITTATLVAYSPVMFDFFNGDDFVHLTWLTQAVQHPELVLRNFHTSWLDGTTTKFYRPLISVFMFTDYIAWGVNGLGFRLTNIAFHLASAIFLYLVSKDLQRKVSGSASNIFALTACALFALYPMHPEAVSWITGRVDSIVTAFCLASIWFYMRWRAGAKWGLPASLAAMTLGLLSKEMAITIPAVLVSYEVCFEARGRNLLMNGLRALAATASFWALLAAYFVVRRLALGTFVGGYDNSLFFIADLKVFVLGWLHALKMFIVPINKSLIGTHSLLYKTWEVLAAVSGALVALLFIRDGKYRSLAAFTLLWLALCLAPVYKLFAIGDDLQGARLAYLATAPLCMLFALAFSDRPFPKFPFRATLAALFCCLAAVVLWINNQPWRQAGEQNNAIRSGLDQLYAGIAGDPQVLFVGLPDQINGAYTCRNSLDGMTKSPQMHRDVKNCLAINPYEPIFPFGFLKESIVASREKIHLFRWDSNLQKFQKIAVPTSQSAADERRFSGANLAQMLSPGANVLVQTTSEAARISTQAKPGYVDISLPSLSCWTTDVIALVVDQDNPAPADLNLLYTTKFEPEFELKRRTLGRVPGQTSSETVLFALRGLPDWSLGQEFHKMRLFVPANFTFGLKEFNLVNAHEVMPRIEFENSGYLGSKGYMHLSDSEPSRQITVDATALAEASRWQLEITRVNLLFEEQNTTKYSSVKWKTIDGEPGKLRGAVRLNHKDFPSAGMYEIRAWALGADGAPVGLCSDHVVLSVDN